MISAVNLEFNSKFKTEQKANALQQQNEYDDFLNA